MPAIKDLTTHPETYVTVAELAAHWGYAERTVRYWIEKKTLRASRIGGSWRVRTVDAIAFGRPYEPTFGPVASA